MLWGIHLLYKNQYFGFFVVQRLKTVTSAYIYCMWRVGIKLVKRRITAVPYLIINKTRWEFLFSLLPIHYIGFQMSNYTLQKFREHYNPYQNINLSVGPANLDSLGALMSFSMLVCSVWLKSLHVKNISAENTNTIDSWPILSAITGRKCDAGRHNYPKGMENWNDNKDR